MAETSGPWGGTPGTFGEDSWSQWWALHAPNGVYSDPQGIELLPYADASGMVVKVRAGSAFINGQFYNNSAERVLTIRNGDSQPRVDTVMLTRDATANTILVSIVEGTPAASNPVAVTPTSQQIPLSHVNVAANRTTNIAPGEAVDWRPFMPRYSRAVPLNGNEPSAPRLGDLLTEDDSLNFWTTGGWQQVQAAQDTGWVGCPMASGWGRYTGGGGYPIQPEARLLNGVVYVRGLMLKTGTGTPRTTYSPVCTLPPNMAPRARHRWTSNIDDGSPAGALLDMWITTTGDLSLTCAGSIPAGALFSIDTNFAV